MHSTDRARAIRHLVVIAKECLPGRVKTRLTPPYTPEAAAMIAAASLTQTLDVVRSVDVADRVLLLEGSSTGLDLAGFRLVEQGPGSLDQRIAAAFDDADEGMLLIGMDTPQIAPGLLQEVVDDERSDSWFGPAADGGFWALGLRRPRGALVRGVAMSRPDTGSVQLSRLRRAGLRPERLLELRDVDTAADAAEVARSVPDSLFARALEAADSGALSGRSPAGDAVRPLRLRSLHDVRVS